MSESERHSEPVISLAYSHDGSVLASGDYSGRLIFQAAERDGGIGRVIDSKSGSSDTSEMKMQTAIRQLLPCSDAPCIVARYSSGDVKCWGLERIDTSLQWTIETGSGDEIELSSRGTFVAHQRGGDILQPTVWELGRKVMDLSVPGGVDEHLISTEGRYVAGLNRQDSDKNDLYVWDADREYSLKKYKIASARALIGFVPGGDVLALGMAYHSKGVKEPTFAVLFYDVVKRKRVAEIQFDTVMFGVRLSPTGDTLFTEGCVRQLGPRAYEGCNVDAWDISTGSKVGTMTMTETKARLRAVSQTRLLLGVSDGGEVIIWDFSKREEMGRFRKAGDEVESMAFSPNDEQVAVGYISGDIRVWNLKSGREISP